MALAGAHRGRAGLLLSARADRYGLSGNFVWVDLALGPATALLLAAVAVGRPSPFVHVLETRPLQRLGACSYSLYLTHSPIVVTVHHVVRRLERRDGDADVPRHTRDRRAARRRLRDVVRVALRDSVPEAPELGGVAGRGLRPVGREALSVDRAEPG